MAGPPRSRTLGWRTRTAGALLLGCAAAAVAGIAMLVRHKTGEGVDLAELLLAMTGFAAGCFGALLLLLGARIHDREAVARRWTVRDGPRR